MHFDIRTKLILLLATNICTYLLNNIAAEVISIFFIMLVQFLSGRKNTAWKAGGFYLVLVVMQLLLLPLLPLAMRMILSVPVVQFRKMFPLLMSLILIVKTTRVSEVTATLQKIKVPRTVNMTIAIAMRYFPVLAEEWRHIREAMSIRSIAIIDYNPVKCMNQLLQYYMVPLMISASKTIDELTAASITRGIDNPGKRSCWGYKKMMIQDYILLLICVSAVAAAIMKKFHIF